MTRPARAGTPEPCKCSHPSSNHNTRTGRCWNVVCGCMIYRPKEATR